MAEHNIVVFAGDHCGPEVIGHPTLSHPCRDGESTDHDISDRLSLRRSRYETEEIIGDRAYLTLITGHQEGRGIEPFGWQIQLAGAAAWRGKLFLRDR